MDVDLYLDNDGGEIRYVNGKAVMVQDGGLKMAVILSMFGGNELDSGEKGDDRQQWWGNLGETEEAKQYRSRTQYLLRALPAVSANLRKLEDAMQADLAWMSDEFAATIETVATLTAPRKVKLEPTITIGESRYTFEFDEDWDS